MVAKSISKITRFNLFGLTKRFLTDNSPNRIVTSASKQLNKVSRNVEADYSKSFIKEKAAREYKIHAMRRLENELAAEQVRKCNEILREHYFQKRKLQKILNNGVTEDEPTLSKKLKEIMSKDAANSVTTISTAAANFKRFPDFESKRNLIDHRPQNCGYLNRWHIKIPSPTRKEFEDTNLISQTASRRVDKVFRFPESNAPTYTSSNETKNQPRLRRSQIQNMWQIGSRKIPRLT